jgi:hypothetical protein
MSAKTANRYLTLNLLIVFSLLYVVQATSFSSYGDAEFTLQDYRIKHALSSALNQYHYDLMNSSSDISCTTLL